MMHGIADERCFTIHGARGNFTTTTTTTRKSGGELITNVRTIAEGNPTEFTPGFERRKKSISAPVSSSSFEKIIPLAFASGSRILHKCPQSSGITIESRRTVRNTRCVFVSCWPLRKTRSKISCACDSGYRCSFLIHRNS